MEMKQRMLSLINEMNKNIYEKDSEISLSLLAAIAGESIILPGSSKEHGGAQTKKCVPQCTII